MPAGKKKSYNLVKYEQTQKRRAEQAARKAHASQRKAGSYLSEDEQLISWKLHLNKLGLELRDIPADGNCLFRALADQLDGNSLNHMRYRSEVCDYMIEHQKDFAPFLDDTDTCFDKYISNLRKPGTFAGNDSLVAFARLHRVTIVVHQLDSASFSIDGCDNNEGVAELHLTYHHGEHYSSIRRLGDRSSTPARIKFSRTQTNDTESQSYQMEIISRSTGCEDNQLIEQSLEECEGDLDAAIDYINSLSLAQKTDSSSCGSINSCAYHSELSNRVDSSTTIDSGVCTCDSNSTRSSSDIINCDNGDSGSNGAGSKGQGEKVKPAPSKPKQSTKKLSKAERKKEKKKRAEERHKADHEKPDHSAPPSEVFEVVSKVTLLSV
ncbi:OTU domain-containing protein 3-like isoform X2 [Watersipora subatra]